MKSTGKFLILFLLILQSWAGYGQKDSALFKGLDAVVVTGQYEPQSLTKSVYQVKVISREQIELKGALNIQQALNDELGFRISNDNAVGISDVQLNGLGGNNVKILLDGVPLDDRYDERVSLSQIDVHNIERIEVIEGPMSVSYGSDAMAGVINIITRKDVPDNLSVNAHVQEETAGNEYYPFSYKGVHNQNVGVSYKKNRFFVSAGGTHNDFDGYLGDKYGRGKTWKPKEQWIGNARVGYIAPKFNVYYRIDGTHEDIVSRDPINMNTYKATDQKFITNRYIHQIQGDYTIKKDLHLDGYLALSNYRRQTETFHRNFENNTVVTGLPGDNDLTKLNSFSFKTTLQYRISPIVSLQPGVDINHEATSGDRVEGSPTINDYAFFVSSEIAPTSFFSLRPGIRFSSNSQYNAPRAIPSINTKFDLGHDLILRLSYGNGFRAPTLRELYLSFFDVNHNLIGNKDLKAEKANSVNGSLTYTPYLDQAKTIALKSTLSGFYTAFSNEIDLVQSITDPEEYTYYNIDKSKTAGGKLENSLFLKRFIIGLGFSYTGFSSSQFNDGDMIKQDHRDYLWTPEINASIVYKLDKIKSEVSLFYKFTGKKPAFSLGEIDSKDAVLLTSTSAYSMSDFSFTTNFSRLISTQIGVKNIFNVTNVKSNTTFTAGSGLPTGGPLVVGYGRSYFIGVSLHWNHK